MKTVMKVAGIATLAALLLTGCSAFAEEPEPTPTRTPVSGTITMPDGPTGGAPTPTATPEPSETAAPFPFEGVNAQGITRDQAAESKFLNSIGLGPEPVLDANGKTPAIIVAELEDFEPTSDFFTNIIYSGCAAALEEAATPPAEMLQRVVNLTAEKLRHATADDIMTQGYVPIITAGTALLCGDRFPPLAQTETG